MFDRMIGLARDKEKHDPPSASSLDIPSPSMNIVYFGDQLTSYREGLLELTKRSKYVPLLASFFDSAFDVLKQELNGIDSQAFQYVTSSSSFTELCKEIQKAENIDPVLNGALLYIFQAGCYICQATQIESSRMVLGNTIIFGMCTGLIPAAALAAAETQTQLLSISVELVKFSVRINAATKLRTEEIEPLSVPKKSAVVSIKMLEADVKEALEKYHNHTNIPLSRSVYISATSCKSTSVSGPPSTLNAFVEFSKAKVGSSRFLPLQTLFHALHLRDIPSDDLIPVAVRDIPLCVEGPLIFSTSTGEIFKGDTLGELLKEIAVDVLKNVLRVDTLIDSICAHVQGSGVQEVSVYQMGGEIPRSLSTTLESAGIAAKTFSLETVAPKLRRTSDNDIAIVGMAGRFPGADNLEEFWQVFLRAQQLHKEIPGDRFDLKTHYDSTGELRNSTLTPYGCFLDSPGDFDVRMFNMSPREALNTDPQQRLVLMTTYEALENAGYVPNRTNSTNVRRIGTFFGQATDDYRECNSSQDIDMYYATGGLRPFGPGRLNFHFGWEGPSFSIDTACSSSLSSIHLACSSILNKECGMAVAGGMNILTGSPLFAGLSRGSFLSKTGGCSTFDDKADGYCRAEAVATVILKRLKDAIADGDNVLGVIKATARNHSAESVSITHPHVATQQRLFDLVLNKAGVGPQEVDYVEMHGTGTQAGDAAEMASVTNTFAPTERQRPLYLGSIKPNVGHSEAASGVTSLMRALMMLQKGIITPATAGIKTVLNHNFPDLAALNVHIPQTLIGFGPENVHKRKIIVNNFDAAAGNTALLVEDFTEVPLKGVDPRPAFAITVSAKTVQSLEGNIQRLVKYLEKNPRLSLGDLSYTTTARRMHHYLRRSFVCSTITEAKHSLESTIKLLPTGTAKDNPPRLAFTFTGQGLNYVGLATQLFEQCATFRNAILRFDAICKSLAFPAILPIVDGSNIKSLSQVQYQLGVVAIQLAILQLWRSYGLEPSICIGHSLGEYAALCAAGVLSISDTLFLVGQRATLMTTKCTPDTHGMLVVFLSGEDAKSAILESGTSCEVACYNTPSATVISGPVSEIDSLEVYLQQKSLTSLRLTVPFAFHSAQMDGVMEEFEAVAAQIEYRKPRIPVMSTKLGRVVTECGTFNASYLARQMREPVQFLQALQSASVTHGVNNNNTFWIGTGPSTTLRMIMSVLEIPDTYCAASLDDAHENWYTISYGLSKAYNAGLDVSWGEYHRQYERAHRLLQLPNYVFELKNYWVPYRGEWCITKGQQDHTLSATTSVSAKPSFYTTSLQRVVKEDDHEGYLMAVFESDLCYPALSAVVKGHFVGGVGLCPGAVYADMAYSAAKYFHTLTHGRGASTPAISVETMEIFSPLVIDDTAETQVVRVDARMQKEGDIVEVKYSSMQESGMVAHAKCLVKYGDSNKWTSKWQKNSWLIQSRIEALTNMPGARNVHHLLRPMIYKLFSTLVEYRNRYQGLQEVWMDSQRLEAAGKIQFQAASIGDVFLQPPYWIDVFVHLAGFVLNGTDMTPADTVYISHGWQSMKFLGSSFSADTIYWAHVRMQPTGNRGELVGDVFVFDEAVDQVVFSCRGIKFQSLPKQSLLSLLNAGDQRRGINPEVAIQTSLLPALPISDPTRATLVVPISEAAALEDASATQYAPSTRAAKPETISCDDILQIIADEIGVSITDLTDDITFGELGVDSLLSLSLLTKLRSMLSSINLATSLFGRHSTIKSFKAYLSAKNLHPKLVNKPAIVGLPSPTASGPTLLPSPVPANTPGKMEEVNREAMSENSLTPTSIGQAMSFVPSAGAPSSSVPIAAECFLLQGDPSAKVSLFLCPDGSGSASTYAPLPTLGSDAAIYGIHSPFAKNPAAYTIPLVETIPLYLAAIRTVRPHGPYILGGYSIGGSYAYECVVELIASGEEVLGMVFIDSPCRLRFPPIPKTTTPYLIAAGIFDVIQVKGKLPEIVWKHFEVSLDALENYRPRFIADPAKIPKAYAIWCNEGVVEWADKQMGSNAPQWDDDGKAGNWFMNPRTDFGPMGWDALLNVVETVAVDGNHFTLMTDSLVLSVGKELKRFLDMILQE